MRKPRRTPRSASTLQAELNTPLRKADHALRQYPPTARLNKELRACAAELIVVYAGLDGGKVVTDAEEKASQMKLNLNAIQMVFALLLATGKLSAPCQGAKAKWHTQGSNSCKRRAERMIADGFAWDKPPNAPTS